MAEIDNYRVDNNLGCGFMGGIFQCWSHWSRKSHVHSLPSSGTKAPPGSENPKKASSQSSRRRRSSSSSAGPAFPDNSTSAKPAQKLDQKPTRNVPLDHPRTSTSRRKNQGRRHSDAARSSTSSSNGSGQNHDSAGEERKLGRESTPNSLELSRIVKDHRQQPDESKALVKASSTGSIVLGHMGNLKQPGSTRSSLATNSPGSASRAMLALVKSVPSKNGYGGGNNTTMGNIVRRYSCSDAFRGVSNELDPEALKRMGNEDYKQGRFKEALDLYDRAISLDSNKAAYHSNKSAALIGLGRLLDAVFESQEAIRIEPSYQRAHHRLATLFIRYHSIDHKKISLREKRK